MQVVKVVHKGVLTREEDNMLKPESEMSEEHFITLLMLYNSVLILLPEHVKKMLGERIVEQSDALAAQWLERGAPPDLVERNSAELDVLSDRLLSRGRPSPVTSGQTTPAGNSRWN